MKLRCTAASSLLRICYRQRTFWLAFLLGCVLAFASFNHETHKVCPSQTPRQRHSPVDNSYSAWLRSQGLVSQPVEPDLASYGPKFESEADFLAKKVHLVCLVFVRNAKGAGAIRDTWSKHCSQTIFSGMFSSTDPKVKKFDPVSSWHWLCESLRHVWHKNKHDLQWVFVASDEIYAIPDNLRRYLAPMHSDKQLYLGHAMRFWAEVYNLGRSGYALSRGTMKAFMRRFNSSESCMESGKYWKNEDWYLGKHLAAMKIYPQDTRDPQGYNRFNSYSITQLMFSGALSIFSRYWRDSVYLSKDKKCCSEEAITFHGIDSGKMYLLDYFLYHVRPFYHGGTLGNMPPLELNVTKVSKVPHLNHVHWQLMTTPKNLVQKMNALLDF